MPSGHSKIQNLAKLTVRMLGATDLIVRMRLAKYPANKEKITIQNAEKLTRLNNEAYNWEMYCFLSPRPP